MQACAALFFLLIACLPAHAQSAANPTPAIPEDLQPWIGWVLHGHENERCPLVHGSDRRQCAWPSRLRLDLADTGGKFSQEWYVDAPTWVPLPGDAKIWPQDVSVGGKDAVVVSRQEKPHVELDPGRHVVSGAFRWDSLPSSLTVPDETGLLALSVGGEKLLFPERDDSGQVWLQRVTEPEEQDRLDVKVHRRILDDIPLQMTTRIDLEVAGKSREELLGRPLLDGFVPMALQSVLPVRLEPDGRLRVQVRPGTWTIDVVTRHQGPVQELRLNEPGGPWDAQEVWVFEARNDLRVVTLEGVPAIDPQQTELPGDWRALPAYALKPGESLRLVEKQRGDADPSPDRLSLQRTWWLDFDGGGYTVRDQLSGMMSRDWRLSMRSPARLGRVAVDGRDQLITESPDGAAGVEVRQSNVRIEAESRVEGNIRNVDAVAWDHDVQSLGGELRLGPGWRLLHARGVDRASETWVSRWTLFDLFVVLLFAMTFSHLWGWAWGAAALLAFGITYTEPGAPGAVWAAVLVGAALVRVLPLGRWLRAARVLNIVAFLVLLVDAVPFMVQQARQALYPALTELGEYAVGDYTAAQDEREPAASPPPTEDSVMMRSKSAGSLEDRSLHQAIQKYSYEVDPNAQVQTGPGMPQWYWRTISLEWSGPVEASQQLRLILIPPWLNRVIDVLRLLLLAALLICIAREVRAAALKSGAAAILVLGLLMNAPAAQAELPNGELLEQLRARLLEQPTCAPTCASSPEMFVEADAGSLRLRLRIDAAAPVAVPLPGRANQWIAEDILLDGEPAPALMQDDGLVWIRVDAGRHDVVLRGALPKRNEVQLHLPLLPHRVSSRVAGWTIAGIHEDGIADSDIVLVRIRTAEETATAPGTLEPNTLPPFVYVTRALRFGLTWEVETSVRRATPPGVAAVVEVPLLPGEAVTTPDVRIAGGKVVVNLDAAEMEHEWRSILPQGDKVTLVAGDVPSVAEVWYADASPIWHVEATGIPTIHEPTADASRMRRWHPWPGESIVLAITKPAAISGRTLTLDSAQVSVTPGLRATDASVALSIRSSRGGEHTVTLPEEAELQSVDIDGTPVPIRQNERKVTLPLTPGSQRVQVAWRQPGSLGFRFVSPQIDVGAPVVNVTLDLVMPQDRWTLFMNGPLMGPAVLFWGLLTVFLLVSIALGRVRTTPLAWYHWFLLSIGLTQVPIAMAMIVIAWLLMLGWRRTRIAASPREFDLLQLLIVGSTVAALACLFFSIQQGLLGLPEMQITGNGSTAYELRWFQDISGNVLPQAVVYSVPLLVYRLAMLLWALWLASALLRWLRWGWESFASGGLWRPLRRRFPDAVPPSSEGV